MIWKNSQSLATKGSQFSRCVRAGFPEVSSAPKPTEGWSHVNIHPNSILGWKDHGVKVKCRRGCLVSSETASTLGSQQRLVEGAERRRSQGHGRPHVWGKGFSDDKFDRLHLQMNTPIGKRMRDFPSFP